MGTCTVSVLHYFCVTGISFCTHSITYICTCSIVSFVTVSGALNVDPCRLYLSQTCSNCRFYLNLFQDVLMATRGGKKLKLCNLQSGKATQILDFEASIVLTEIKVNISTMYNFLYMQLYILSYLNFNS